MQTILNKMWPFKTIGYLALTQNHNENYTVDNVKPQHTKLSINISPTHDREQLQSVSIERAENCYRLQQYHTSTEQSLCGRHPVMYKATELN